MDRDALSRGLGSEELPPEISAQIGDEERRIARLCLSVLAVLGTGSLIGAAWSLYLVNHYPLILIALSPIGRHLILVAPTVNPLAFILVAVGRRLLFYTACFHLGRSLGPWGLVWLESRAERMGRFIRWLERLFQKAPKTAIFFLVGPGMSSIAGISGMAPRTWGALVSAGLVFRMVLTLWLAEWLREPIEALLLLIDEYWVPGTVVLMLGVGIYQWRRIRRRRAAPPFPAEGDAAEGDTSQSPH